MAEKKNTDTTGASAKSTQADQPNPDATKDVEGTATPEEAVAAQLDVALPPVEGQENTVLETPEVRDIEAEVNDEAVAPLPGGGPIVRADTVPVYEVHVTTDEQVDYVIVPPEGRGSAILPIHQFVGARKPEDVFADEASTNDDDKS